MKYLLLFFTSTLLYAQNSIVQAQDSTRWKKYYTQIERLFEKARANQKNEEFSYNPEMARREDSLMKEWEQAAIVIQNNSNLSDSAKVESGFEKYWDLFGECRDTFVW